MTRVRFGRLQDLAPREAWTHEAQDFTPWLAENIEQIAEAIGVPLELTGQEVAVETFSADILARNPQDDSLILIENQLETTDHTHLGQIMTYLAGLEATTVVWIAPAFREPHLSAIRWLNEHTADGFAFFAIRLRVVRIGDSPYAPVFEVVEQPNDWDREIRQKAASEGASYYDIKKRFWQEMIARHPDLEEIGFRLWRYPNNYVRLHRAPEIHLSVWIGKTRSGAFVRSGWGEPFEPMKEALAPHAADLERRLGVGFGPQGRGDHCFAQEYPKGHEHADAWPEIMDWMHRRIAEYRAAFADIFEGDD